MSCSDCPSTVVHVIAHPVWMTLGRVRRLKALTQSFNSLLADLASTIQDDLSTLAGLVPSVPILDITELVDILQCPLTPLAIEAMLLPSVINGSLLAAVQGMSGEDLWRIARNMQRRACSQVSTDYEDALRNLRSYETVALVRRYVQQVLRCVGDAAEFAIDYPHALRVSAMVKQLCPDIYEDDAYPFKAMVEEVTDWSFDGLVCSDLDPRASANVGHIASGEVRVDAWRTIQSSV